MSSPAGDWSSEVLTVSGGVEKDVRYFLREYGQSDEKEECERRWVEFVGVPWAWRKGWVQDDLVFESYTAV